MSASRADDAPNGAADGAAGVQDAQDAKDAVRLGLIFAVAAYAIWGLFPIYIKQVASVSPLEVVGHRIVWSVPFGAAILALRKQWPETIAAFRNMRLLRALAFSSAVIALNWLFYVWAVANDRVLEASLGYYINPLMFVAAGVVVLGEQLSRAQTIAVALACLGVAALTIGAGVFPWVALILACSFTTYGFVRKTTNVGAMPGLFIETVLLAPFALATLFWLAQTRGLAFVDEGPGMATLLALGGPVTVGPLVLFALAARRLKLSTIGFIQYIGPTGQFFLGLYYGETFTLAHGICFGLIWTALLVVSVDAVRKQRGADCAGPPSAAGGFKRRFGLRRPADRT